MPTFSRDTEHFSEDDSREVDGEDSSGMEEANEDSREVDGEDSSGMEEANEDEEDEGWKVRKGKGASAAAPGMG